MNPSNTAIVTAANETYIAGLIKVASSRVKAIGKPALLIKYSPTSYGNDIICQNPILTILG